MKKILLLTRLATQNAGNEALSSELISLVRNLLPSAEVRALDRYPHFFSQFDLASMGEHSQDIVRHFDELCRKLIAQFGSSVGPLAPLAGENLVRLDRTAKEMPSWIGNAKRKVAFRRRMARLGILGRQDAAETIRSCRWPDLLVWNPAGEIHNPGHFSKGSSDQVFRLLLLVRIAQLSNVKTMMINHSLETHDPALRAVIRHVYSHAVRVALRDNQSYQAALALGVDNSRLIEIPDIVFLVADSESKIVLPAEERFETGTICLAVNGRHAYNRQEEWDRLMTGLKQFNRPLGFLTNAMNHDLPVVRDLAKRHGVKFVDRQPSYREIQAFFEDVDLLIGSRFHSNIIALCAGVPVISLEASQFKMTAAFDQMEYPIRTTQMSSADWPEQVIKLVQGVFQGSLSQASSTSREVAKRQADAVRTAYQRILAADERDARAA